jgi:hypothetical protein
VSRTTSDPLRAGTNPAPHHVKGGARGP